LKSTRTLTFDNIRTFLFECCCWISFWRGFHIRCHFTLKCLSLPLLSSLSLFSFRFTLICGKMVFWPLDISAHDQFADSSRHTLSISKWYWRIMNPREALFSLRELSEWNTLQLWSVFFLMVFIMFNSRMFHHLLVRSTLLWFARSLARSDYTWSVAQGFQVGDLFTGTNVEREVMCIQSDSTSQNTKVTSSWTILPPLPSYDYDYDYDSICFQSLSSLTTHVLSLTLSLSHSLSHTLTHTKLFQWQTCKSIVGLLLRLCGSVGRGFVDFSYEWTNLSCQRNERCKINRRYVYYWFFSVSWGTTALILFCCVWVWSQIKWNEMKSIC
jgi:hypothetical protein